MLLMIYLKKIFKYPLTSLFTIVIILLALILIIQLNYLLNQINKISIKNDRLKLKNLQLHINDLKNIKESYLNELKEIELRRNDLFDSMNILSNHMSDAKNDLKKLNEQKLFNQIEIENQNFKLKQIENDLNLKSNYLNSIQIQTNFLLNNNNLEYFKIENVKQSIESCTNLNKCDSSKFTLFILNQPSSILIDLNRFNQSINLVNDYQQTCFTLIYLDRSTDFNLINHFLNNTNNLLKNILFLSTLKQISTRYDLINILKPINNQIEQILKCSFFASFYTFLPNDNFFLNFGLHTHELNSINLTKFTNERIFLISYHQSLNSFHDSKLKIIQQLFNNITNIAINLECKQENLDLNLCFNLNERLNILKMSKFTFIHPEHDPIARLIESLHSSTIPILIDLDYQLPFYDLIEWDEILIRLPFYKLNQLLSILNHLNYYDLTQRQIKARNVYKSYFSSTTTQLLTLIAGLNNRLVLSSSPLLAESSQEFNINFDLNDVKLEQEFDYEDDVDEEYLGKVNQEPINSDEFNKNYTQSKYHIWNVIYHPFNLFQSIPFDLNQQNNDIFNLKLNEIKLDNYTFGGGDGSYFNHYLSGNYKEEQFTIVILCFNREKILINNLYKYLKLPYLNSILLVWNSIDTEPSQEFNTKYYYYLKSKRLRVLKMYKNSLNNRFVPYDNIKTDAVLNLDDDVYLRPDEILFAFRVWRENRDRIVGFPARYHTWNFTSNSYFYKSYLSCEYSMILTGAAFYHRFYNYYYSQVMDDRVRLKVDGLMNCEDIGFNMMVSHLTRKPPIKVTTKYSFYCSDCESLNQNSTNLIDEIQNDLPVSLKSGHYEKRTECLSYFIDNIYGYNPLLYSQFRADSVLYKTKLPLDKQKCFKLV